MRILVIEDEKKVASLIKRGLSDHGFSVDLATNGDSGLAQAQQYAYDVIVLDIMLPGKDGMFICRQLRKQNIRVPILMLTARDDVEDKISGLDSGADDYLTKPFEFVEFLARVKALIRRKDRVIDTRLKVRDLEMDQLTRRVTRAGREIDLTSTEYSLLEYLMLNANQIVTRDMICEHVWSGDLDSFSNVVNVYINYLRKKIDADGQVSMIQSVRGTGYVLKGE